MMNKEQARKILPILQAFAEGKTIQSRMSDEDAWRDANELDITDSYQYRIKPIPICRPFKNAEECLEEMRFHVPFGWIKDNKKERYFNICCVSKKVELYPSGIWAFSCSFEDMMHDYTFVDGTPFGKQVE